MQRKGIGRIAICNDTRIYNIYIYKENTLVQISYIMYLHFDVKLSKNCSNEIFTQRYILKYY